MGWDEKLGTVSISFDQWKLADREIRSFWQFTMRVLSSEHERVWERMRHKSYEIDDPDGPWSYESEWMLRAAMWKDAVTAYEVYVENSFHEVLKFQRMKYARQYAE